LTAHSVIEAEGPPAPPDLRKAPLPDIVTLRGLAKSYRGGSNVLDGVDMRIAECERVALIGANGSGKSTLLKLLIGLIAASDGSITTLGETFQRAPSAAQRKRLCRQIGFVFQNHGLVARISAHSNVVQGMLGLPGGWRAVSQAIAPPDWRVRALSALQEVGLADKASARADQLSGGQAQRVAIARALVRRPRLLIADEPAASLDPAAGHDVMRVFSERARDHGISLLYTTHDMEHALAYSDRVVALRQGRVVLDEASGALDVLQLEKVFHG